MPKPLSTTAASTGEQASGPQLSRFQSFVPTRMHRGEIDFAAYNPRRDLTQAERRKLGKLLEKHGLFNAVVVNARTPAKGWPPRPAAAHERRDDGS